MTTITTKYSIGDKVFHASLTTERRQHPCPDCKGEKKWSAKSPAGMEYTFACPRCSANYNNDRDLMLDYSAYTPLVGWLTIGSIQYNTAKGSYDEGARYMCQETGIGSGTVYNESDLFPTEEDALGAAKIKADLANAKTEWVVKQYDKALKVSDYQLDSATLKLASEAKSRASSLLWNLNDLFSRIEEADDKDAILEAVNDYKTYDWERDKEKVGLSRTPQASAEAKS
jgi:hypothetical protein